MSRMFQIDGRPMQTWNPFSGCLFQCAYCWARPLALGRLKNRGKYANGFDPTFHPETLTKRFKPGSFVFISSMGDISFAKTSDVARILELVRGFPQTSFLFCTKDPGGYLQWEDMGFPDNLYLGATIESNRVYDSISKAPAPMKRYLALGAVKHPRKFVAIEPVMDFNLLILVKWLKGIAPEIVEVGADNHGHSLPEPAPEKLGRLLEELRTFVPTVVEKAGLDRLKC